MQREEDRVTNNSSKPTCIDLVDDVHDVVSATDSFAQSLHSD